MSDPNNPRPPAGWYPDASGNGTRYWDGEQWTDQWQPTPPPAYPTPPAYPPPTGGPGYPSPYQQPAAAGSLYSTLAIVFGCLAIGILPILFGPVGLILGGIAKSRGERSAVLALWIAGGGMVLGFIVGAVAFHAMMG